MMVNIFSGDNEAGKLDNTSSTVLSIVLLKDNRLQEL